MANNQQPRIGILLSPSVEGERLKITALVTKNSQPQRDIHVTFFLNGNAVVDAVGTTDVQGKVSKTFRIPAGATTVGIKAEAAINGTTTKEITVAIPSAMPGRSHRSVPTLVVEDTKMSETHHRLSMAIFCPEGQMVPGTAQLSSSANVSITTPQPTRLNHTGRHGAPRAINQYNRPNNTFELTFSGTRWETIDIEHTTAFELDVFVAEWNRKIELEFDGPRSASHGQVPLTRPLFAGMFSWLFFTGLFSTIIFGVAVLMPWPPILALVPAVLVTLLFLASARIYNRRLRNPRREAPPHPGIFASLVSTNNHWLISMAALDVLMFIVVIWSLFTMWGSPILMQDNRDNIPEVRRVHERRPGDDAQRIRNIQRSLGPATDRELTKQEPEIPWQPLVVRFIVFLLMLLLTILYIPIAASDEVGGFAHRLMGHFGHSHTEGTSDGGFISRMIARFRPAIEVSSEGVRVEPQGPDAPQGQTPPPQNSSGAAGWLRSLIPAVVADFIIGGIIDSIITLVRRNRRQSSRRRAEA